MHESWNLFQRIRPSEANLEFQLSSLYKCHIRIYLSPGSETTDMCTEYIRIRKPKCIFSWGFSYPVTYIDVLLLHKQQKLTGEVSIREHIDYQFPCYQQITSHKPLHIPICWLQNNTILQSILWLDGNQNLEDNLAN